MFYKHAIVTLLILKHCNKVSNMKHDALRELYVAQVKLLFTYPLESCMERKHTQYVN